jgi:hypothetical protein
MTFAFNIDTVFQQVLSADNDVLRHIVKDDPLGEEESIAHDRDVIFAAGGYLGEGALANFLTERSNPVNRNRYIHNKFMLVDPLSDDPLVITGSANFSRPSQRTNDENMLILRGNTRVADIYFGEFMRVFDHHYARYLVRVLTDEGRSDPGLRRWRIHEPPLRRPTGVHCCRVEEAAPPRCWPSMRRVPRRGLGSAVPAHRCSALLDHHNPRVHFWPQAGCIQRHQPPAGSQQ